jgi:hypothetical protein
MRRREFVAASSAFAASASGCIGIFGDEDDGMVTGDVPPDASYAVSVGVEGLSRAAPIDIAVRLVRAGFSGVHQPVDDATLGEYRDGFEDAVRRDDEQDVENISAKIRNEYSPDGAGRFELTLTNTADETVEVFSGAPAPFGVLYAEEVGDDSGSRRLLWSDAYAESDYVNFYPHGLVLEDIGLTTEIPPSESETETYDVAFPPGEYRVDGSVDVSRSDGEGYGDGETYPYTVVIEVTENDAEA